MYWTLELASYLSDAPWPANKDELIDYSTWNRKNIPQGPSVSYLGELFYRLNYFFFTHKINYK